MASETTDYGSRWQGEGQDCTPEIPTEKTSTIEQIKNRAADFAQTATDKIDENRKTAASAVESAAMKLHDKAECLPGGEKAATFAHRTAQGLERTADYLRENDTRAMVNDVQRLIKEHPAESLAVAAAVGFLVGRAFRRSEY